MTDRSRAKDGADGEEEHWGSNRSDERGDYEHAQFHTGQLERRWGRQLGLCAQIAVVRMPDILPSLP